MARLIIMTKTTTDILFQSVAIQPAPASTYWINIPGHLKNTGFEFAVGATIIQKTDFTLDATFNIANNKNKLTEFLCLAQNSFGDLDRYDRWTRSIRNIITNYY